MRVLNLGVGGMGSFEGVAILRRVLAHAGDRLAWVFYEEPLFDPLLWYPDVINPRYVHWHDVRSTVDAIDALSVPAAPPDYKLDQYESHWSVRGPTFLPDAARDAVARVTGGTWRRAAAWEHLRLCARRESAIAEGPGLASAVLGRDVLWPTRTQLEHDRGWADIALDPDPGAQKQHERFEAGLASWSKQLEALRAAESVRPPVAGNYDVDALRALLRDIDAQGAAPIVYVAPRASPSPMMNSLHDAGEIQALFQFNAPSRYPELDDADLRWDSNHLNRPGAETWSRLFARRFARHLDETGASATRRPHASGPPDAGDD